MKFIAKNGKTYEGTPAEEEKTLCDIKNCLLITHFHCSMCQSIDGKHSQQCKYKIAIFPKPQEEEKSYDQGVSDGMDTVFGMIKDGSLQEEARKILIMNYELSKKLSNAGFEPLLRGKGHMVAKEIKNGVELIDPLYAPTLEELVDAYVELSKKK